VLSPASAAQILAAAFQRLHARINGLASSGYPSAPLLVAQRAVTATQEAVGFTAEEIGHQAGR